MRDSSLKPHEFFILVALADRDRHGSDVAREVLDLTRGATRLWPVKLYASLEYLVERGCLSELQGAAHPEGKSRRRRYYRITRLGRRMLEAESDRVSQMADVARARNAAGQAVPPGGAR